jgi:hypothetical protein
MLAWKEKTSSTSEMEISEEAPSAALHQELVFNLHACKVMKRYRFNFKIQNEALSMIAVRHAIMPGERGCTRRHSSAWEDGEAHQLAAGWGWGRWL